jgi:hypothetical protein
MSTAENTARPGSRPESCTCFLCGVTRTGPATGWATPGLCGKCWRDVAAGWDRCEEAARRLPPLENGTRDPGWAA